MTSDCASVGGNDGTVPAHIVVTRLFRILASCGLSESQLLAAASSAANAAGGVAPAPNVGGTAALHLVGSAVIFRWRREHTFLGQDGLPKRLPIDDGAESFRSLVAGVADSFSADEVLSYLENLGAIERLRDQQVELRCESLLLRPPRSGSKVASDAVIAHLNSFLRSVEFNLVDRPASAEPRFERASYGFVSDRLVPVFERFVEQRGQDFVDQVDDWLDRHRARATAGDDGSVIAVGAGAYSFVSPELSAKSEK